ncbi:MULTISPECIES: sugar-binding domain-containing protein [unclassified Roseitalea]|uniref:sugar-binding transcriptional regulator n=1 Tax=unclassified Roseitalea TaxID=2639107 RepID=UPI00273E67A0|nr:MULTISPECIES: sugar-binding domain-containing protein [unclassified Roseitalea]
MARLARTPVGLAESDDLRLRAAWLYYSRGMIQREIADRLGVSRSTVIRMLEEARRRGEVQITIEAVPEECTALAVELEQALGIAEAIVVPGSGTPDETARDVGAALGRFLSDVVADDMVIGVGWGRTLDAALGSFRPHRRVGVRVLSLLGGLVEARELNPVDVAWNMASRLDARCLMLLAPLIVDSAETKRRLMDKCGLDRLAELARRMDLAVISCGDVGAQGSSLSQGVLTEAEANALVAAGAVCDTLCQFLDANGRTVDHAVHERVMAIDLDHVATARHVVLASGGAHRARAIGATIARVGCGTLITDEAAAQALLAGQPSA